MGREAPTRFTSPSSSVRSSLACRSNGSSPISSRKMVPPWASSKAPLRSRSAPENAPFSWPKSSDSMRVSAMAEQLTGMNGAGGARRAGVEGPGHQLLAGAGLAEDGDGAFVRIRITHQQRVAQLQIIIFPTLSSI